ncbi:MAG TPA: hypothetical protein VGA36_03340, partial [Nitriliruptorales bacterium]
RVTAVDLDTQEETRLGTGFSAIVQPEPGASGSPRVVIADDDGTRIVSLDGDVLTVPPHTFDIAPVFTGNGDEFLGISGGALLRCGSGGECAAVRGVSRALGGSLATNADGSAIVALSATEVVYATLSGRDVSRERMARFGPTIRPTDVLLWNHCPAPGSAEPPPAGCR